MTRTRDKGGKISGHIVVTTLAPASHFVLLNPSTHHWALNLLIDISEPGHKPDDGVQVEDIDTTNTHHPPSFFKTKSGQKMQTPFLTKNTVYTNRGVHYNTNLETHHPRVLTIRCGAEGVMYNASS